MQLKNNILHYRIEMGYDQGEAAELASISREQWNRIENGKHTPNIFTALSMAAVLDVKVDDLFELTYGETPEELQNSL